MVHPSVHHLPLLGEVALTTVIPGGKAIRPAKRSAAGQRNQAGQQQCQWASKTAGFRAPKVSGPGVRSSRQSLGRCRRSAIHSGRKGRDRFGEFLLPTHAVAVATDVDDVARVEQAVGQLGGQDREARDQNTLRRRFRWSCSSSDTLHSLSFPGQAAFSRSLAYPITPQGVPGRFRLSQRPQSSLPVGALDFHPGRGKNKSAGCPALDFPGGRRPPVPRNLVRC